MSIIDQKIGLHVEFYVYIQILRSKGLHGGQYQEVEFKEKLKASRLKKLGSHDFITAPVRYGKLEER